MSRYNQASQLGIYAYLVGALGDNVYGLATRLQDEGAKSFVDSWNELMAVIERKAVKAYAGETSDDGSSEAQNVDRNARNTRPGKFLSKPDVRTER